MVINFDTYSLRARVLPVYLTLAPAVLMLAALVPDGLQLPLGGAAAIVFLPLSFLMSQVGADFGKRLERSLWKKGGGPPTTRLLRHGNIELNEVTRIRVHGTLRALGLHVPTAEEQSADPVAADNHYESCTDELIRLTRSSSDFPLVFKGLTEYGFRRNLLGLKPFGLIVTIAACIGTGLGMYNDWNPTSPPGVTIVTVLITAALLIVWLVWVTERTVFMAANRYARFILEAALQLKA